MKKTYMVITTGLLSSALVGSFVCCPVFAESPVDIEIVEKVDDGEGGYKLWEDITDAMPGMTYSAIPQIRNIGEMEARIMVCLSESAENGDGASVALPSNTFQIPINPHWLIDADSTNPSDPASGNCYNYDSLLQVGEMTEPVFTEVTLSGNLGNEFKNSTFSLHIDAISRSDDDPVPPTPPEPTPEPTPGPDSPDTGINTWIGEYASYVGITFLLAGVIAMIITLIRRKIIRK